MARAIAPGWWMVFVAFLAFNCGQGLTYGSYGILLPAFQHRFDLSKAAAGSGLTIVVFMMGIGSPLAGMLAQRLSLKRLMIVAAFTSGLSYVGIGMATTFAFVACMYAVIGFGVALLAVVGSVTIAGRWVVVGRAKAMAFATLPVFQFLTPFVAVSLFERVGFQWTCFSLAAGYFFLIPFLLSLKDFPPYLSLGDDSELAAATKSNEVGISTLARPSAHMLADRRFWLLSLAVGTITGGGITFTMHAVSIGLSRGLSLQESSFLLVMFGACGILGGPIFGFIADRTGIVRAYQVNIIVQMLAWTGLATLANFNELLLVSGIIGICMFAVLPLHGTALTELFGPTYLSKAMGFSFFLKLPFLMTFGSGTAFLFDRMGSYRLPLIVYVGLLGIAAVMLLRLQLARPLRAVTIPVSLLDNR